MKHKYLFLTILLLLCVFMLIWESRALDVGDTRETATDLALGTPYTETIDPE